MNGLTLSLSPGTDVHGRGLGAEGAAEGRGARVIGALSPHHGIQSSLALWKEKGGVEEER